MRGGVDDDDRSRGNDDDDGGLRCSAGWNLMLVAYATNCPLADMQKAVGYDELSSANARENASEGEARVYMRTVPSCMTGCSCHAAAADATKPSSLRRREVRAWGEARVGGGRHTRSIVASVVIV